jgi:hypothetical protein
MTNDLSVMRERLRKETATLLGLDIEHLTPAQSIRLDRAATLRLELDDIESRKLVGAQFDAQKYIAISEALERLMGGDPATGADGDFEARYNARVQAEFAGAREELSALLSSQAHNLEARDERECVKFRAEVAELKAANERLRGLHPPAAKSGVNAGLDATPTLPPEQTTSPQPPLPPPNASPPASYLRAAPEPWRVVDGGRDRWSNKG